MAPVIRFLPLPSTPLGRRLGLLACALLLAGCARLPEAMPGLERNLQFTPNDFDSTSMHTRHVLASQARTCEAARRALLSQGYLVNTASAEMVAGRKYYQPQADVHYEVEMRVVCAPEGQGDVRTSAFASALQDRYVIKKVNNSASLGVGGIGSVSLPVSATDDTLVKVGSETITDVQFYERFFQLFERYVPMAPAGTASVQLPVPVATAPAPAPAPAPATTAAVPEPAASASQLPQQERAAAADAPAEQPAPQSIEQLMAQ
ncbi:lipoprotein [Alicycliphilus sp. B1]|nr:lipoprotein [Alicycliphilus sp. B1]